MCAYLNRFVSADTIVPNPANPQSLNRYSYVYNNPVRYVDPTGHLTEDELRQLLGDDYDFLKWLWSTYDPYFWDVIFGEELQSGGVLRATLMEGELHFETVDGRITVTGHCGASSTDLWDWQGKGAYWIRKAGMSDEQANRLRDDIFDRNETGPNSLLEPVWGYSRDPDSGRFTATDYLGAIGVYQVVGEVQMAGGFGQLIGYPGWVDWVVNIVAAWKEWSIAWPKAAIDLVVSVGATYREPREYWAGWTGTWEQGWVNPDIPLRYLRR